MSKAEAPTKSQSKMTADEQLRRFRETAQALGCDEDKDRFERQLGQIATAGSRPPKQPARATKPKAR